MILRLSISFLTNSKLLRTSYFFLKRHLGIQVVISPQIVESDTKVKTTFKLLRSVMIYGLNPHSLKLSVNIFKLRTQFHDIFDSLWKTSIALNVRKKVLYVCT